jgi:hypothetical protein
MGMNPRASSANNRSSIELHIERLIVDESLLSAGQNRWLQRAIELELTQLLREHGLTGLTSGVLYDLPPRRMPVPRSSPLAPLGRQIARTVYAALSSEGGSTAAQDRHRTPR